MRDNLTPWAEDDIAQLRYQLERTQNKKAFETLRVWFRNRSDRPACKGCGSGPRAASPAP